MTCRSGSDRVAGLGVDRVQRQFFDPLRRQIDKRPEPQPDQRRGLTAEDGRCVTVGGQDVCRGIADQDGRGRRLDDALGVGVQNPVLLGLSAQVVQITSALQGQRRLCRQGPDDLFSF